MQERTGGRARPAQTKCVILVFFLERQSPAKSLLHERELEQDLLHSAAARRRMTRRDSQKLRAACSKSPSSSSS